MSHYCRWLTKTPKFLYTALLLSFFIPGALHAQSETFSFYVLDETSKEPIYQCYILVKGKNISSLTDEAGAAKLKASPQDTLVIYQLGYWLKTLAVKELGRLNNQIYLSRKNTVLEEVVITSERLRTIRENDNSAFLDFEFYDDYLLCLINKGGKYNVLGMLDGNGSTLFETPLKVKAEELFKDCLGNIHLLTSDSVYQLYYDYKRIHILPPYPINTYYRYLQTCECQHGDKYIFKEIRYQKLRNTYTYYDVKDSVSKILYCVEDSINIRNFKMDFDIRYFLQMRRSGQAYLYSVTEINKNMEKFREELVLDPEYLRTMKPLESEIKKIDTNFVLFDYNKYEATYFSLNGKLNRKATLTGFSGIYPKLYTDSDSRISVFSERNRNNGLLTLYRFDNLKNKFSHRYTLSEFHFIKNYKIKGNYLYFINKIRTENLVKTKIVKVYIEWEKLH